MKKIIMNWFIKVAWPVILDLLIKYSKEITDYIFSYLKREHEKRKSEKQREKRAEKEIKQQELKNSPNESVNARLRKEIDELSGEIKAYESMIADFQTLLDDSKDKIAEDIQSQTKKLKANSMLREQERSIKLEAPNNILGLESPLKRK